MQMNFFSRPGMLVNEDITSYVLPIVSSLAGKGKPSIFEGSPFNIIRVRSPHVRGRAGERLVKLLALDNGFHVSRSKTADLHINRMNVEVKTAMQKENYGFTINQIRPQDYEYIVLVVFLPQKVYLFTISKEFMMAHCKGQHGGNGATETFIYNASSFEKLWRDFSEYSGMEVFCNVFRTESTSGATDLPEVSHEVEGDHGTA